MSNNVLFFQDGPNAERKLAAALGYHSYVDGGRTIVTEPEVCWPTTRKWMAVIGLILLVASFAAFVTSPPSAYFTLQLPLSLFGLAMGMHLVLFGIVERQRPVVCALRVTTENYLTVTHVYPTAKDPSALIQRLATCVKGTLVVHQ